MTETHQTLLSRNLYIARTAAGLTQHALARRSRVSRATIAQLEAGLGDPRISTIRMLAGALHVTPMQLLIGRAEMQALAQVIQDDTTLLLFQGLTAVNPNTLALEIADRTRDLVSSGGAAVGAALGAAVLPRTGAQIGAALAYHLDKAGVINASSTTDEISSV